MRWSRFLVVLFLFPLLLEAQSLPASWVFRSNTGKNATIAVNTSINPRIGSQLLRPGDAIGVFFKRNDTVCCAGYIVWQSQNAAITAWGDDDQTPMKDGFAEGETINFMLWDAVAAKASAATAQFSLGTSTYSTNSITVLSSLVGAPIVQGVEEVSKLPHGFSLKQNYPNPFNPSTTVELEIRERANYRLTVTDLLGRTRAELINGLLSVGKHLVRIDGRSLSSGVYFCRLEGKQGTLCRVMVVVK